MKIQFNQLQEIEQIANNLASQPTFLGTKLEYAFKRFFKKNQDIFEKYNEELQDAKINNALVNETTKAIIYKPDGKNFENSPEGLKKLYKDIRNINNTWKTKELEVEPFICQEPIDYVKLEEDEIELLKGLIIK